MKKYNHILLILVVIFFSCEDYLDKYPNYQPSAQGYFISEDAAQASRIGMYAKRFAAFTDNKYQWDCITDQLYAQYNWGNVTNIYRGIITPASGGLITELYSGAYQVIATANDHIANIEGMDEGLFKLMTKEEYIAEARFFKAFYYFYLTECYGGVPLYKEKMNVIDDFEVKQTPKAEVIEYILQELDAAIAILPERTYNGYIAKGSAQALKAKVLLHNKRWAEAADVAEDVMESGIFSLDPDYFNLFIKKGQLASNEILYASEFQAPERGHSMHRWLVNSAGGTPRQEFVDFYRMSDGEMPGDSPLDSSSYQNRDPRLYLTVRLPNDVWLDASNTPVGFEPTPTGYYIKKFFNEDITDNTIIEVMGTSEQSIIHLRYAEVLLIFAEAKFQLGEFNQEVYDKTIKLIRDRVGMTNADLSIMSDEDRLELIEYERNVELAFEGHRYFDLKRWGKLGETLLSLTDPVGASIEWKDHFILWPFSYTELNLNPNLVQNDGYN